MSGIYIHIPFCASRCIYCDFYSTTLRNKSHEYVDALIKEYNDRSDFLPREESLRTIYIGGGTPSQLPAREICRLIDVLNQKSVEEITIEANPEDVTDEWIADLAHIQNLRISMGVQSMNDDELQMLNRRHNSHKVIEAVKIMHNAGISNISLDLMYGLPSQTIDSWKRSIEGILALNPEHISAYCLSIEEGTKLSKLVASKVLIPANDELCLQMSDILRLKLRESGYIQYEISNYAKRGFESKHNSSYWDGTPYLGLGPGAHSFDGKNYRCWNEPDLNSYIAGHRFMGGETLSKTDIYNERIMLGLRTVIGVKIEDLELDGFGRKNNIIIDAFMQRHLIDLKNNHLVMTETGLALTDEVIRELMID